MKSNFRKTNTVVMALLAAFTFSSVQAQKPVKIIQGADTLITSNKTWDCDTVYFMKGKIYVTNGAELTIQPGTIVVGDTIAKGTLIITKGSKIHATGTPSCPIVFTSSKGPNRRNRGDWGGVIVLGKASVNTPTGVANIEGLPASSLTEYGGGLNPDDNDNSGEISYVRIEFAGVALSPNNEINGLTMGGVGRGTLVDYVQVSFSNDDSFEWFGGTVNCKHLIAFRGIDDDFDTDFGYSGKVQFGIGLRDSLIADVSGSKAFESDNDASGSTNLPQTRAIFSNFTCSAGGDTTNNINYKDGAHIRRNSHIYLYNSIVMGFPDGVNIDGTTTQTNVTTDTLVQNNIFGTRNSAKNVITTSPSGTTSVITLLESNAANRFYTGNASIRIRKPYKLTAPDFRPFAGSPALSGASFSHVGLNDPFFTPTSYVGAMSASQLSNWAVIWVNWNPAKADYSGACPCAANAAAATVTEDNAVSAVIPETSLYPNPSKGVFNVNVSGFKGTVTIKVTNMNGASVYTATQNVNGKSTVKVNLSNATAGLYFVSVTDGKQTITQKMNIVQ